MLPHRQDVFWILKCLCVWLMVWWVEKKRKQGQQTSDMLMSCCWAFFFFLVIFFFCLIRCPSIQWGHIWFLSLKQWHLKFSFNEMVWDAVVYRMCNFSCTSNGCCHNETVHLLAGVQILHQHLKQHKARLMDCSMWKEFRGRGVINNRNTARTLNPLSHEHIAQIHFKSQNPWDGPLFKNKGEKWFCLRSKRLQLILFFRFVREACFQPQCFSHLNWRTLRFSPNLLEDLAPSALRLRGWAAYG